MEVIGLWLGAAVASLAVLTLLLLAVLGRKLQAKAVKMHRELDSVI